MSRLERNELGSVIRLSKSWTGSEEKSGVSIRQALSQVPNRAHAVTGNGGSHRKMWILRDESPEGERRGRDRRKTLDRSFGNGLSTLIGPANGNVSRPGVGKPNGLEQGLSGTVAKRETGS